jgi:hypothetical protein
MKTLSQRGVVLFGAVLVVSAFVSSPASAASWSPLNSTHHLTATNLSVTAHTSPLNGILGWRCTSSTLEVHVASATTLTINDARFSNCMGTEAASPCTATVKATGLPWAATATSTTNIQIHNIQIDVHYEDTPGAGTICPAWGAKASLTGTLSGGSWNPANNTINLDDELGLTLHYLASSQSSATTVDGVFNDTDGTLRMLM